MMMSAGRHASVPLRSSQFLFLLLVSTTTSGPRHAMGEDEIRMVYNKEDAMSAQVPAHRVCSICLGVAHQLRIAFEKREVMRSSTHGEYAVLTELDAIEALDEACARETMDQYGFIKVDGTSWLTGNGINWMIGYELPKMSTHFVLGWFTHMCREYAESRWEEGVIEFYQKVWLPVRSDPRRGLSHWAIELCMTQHSDCTRVEYQQRTALPKIAKKMKKKKKKKKRRRRKKKAKTKVRKSQQDSSKGRSKAEL